MLLCTPLQQREGELIIWPIVEVVIVPLGTGSASVSKYVAECHRVLVQAKDLKYQLTPMSTIIEGDLDRIFEVVRQMHEVPFQSGALRVGTTIRICFSHLYKNYLKL